MDWRAWSRSSFREPLAGSCMSVTFSRGKRRTHQELCLFLPLPLPQVVFALNQTLFQQESLRAGSFQIPYTTEDLIKHYNCGDLSSIIFNHDTSQVSLAAAALVLCTCPRSATPVSLMLVSPQAGPLQARAKGTSLAPWHIRFPAPPCPRSLHHLTPILLHASGKSAPAFPFWASAMFALVLKLYELILYFLKDPVELR